MRVLIVFACLMTFWGFASAQQADTKGKLTGTVTDSMGAVISNATIVIHWNTKGCDDSPVQNLSQDTTLRTDGEGKFVTNLQPGFYDVVLLAVAFSPRAMEVRIRKNETSNLNVKLNVDPLLTAECGDEFPSEPAVPVLQIPPR